MADSVDTLRKEIDTLDNNIHDMLMRRAELVLKIGEEKRKNKIQVVQPDREAVMIRRLMDRHQGPLPRAAIVRIWRELVGAVSLLQTGLKVAISVPEDRMIDAWDMTKNYFGSVLPMTRTTNPLAAVSMVKEGDVTFAVLPWPDDQDTNPWWAYLEDESAEKTVRVVAALPYGNHDRMRSGFRGLVVGCLNFNTSGDDHSFLLLDLDDSVSRGRILDTLKAAGLTPVSIYSHKAPGGMPRTRHFVEVDKYVAAGEKTDAILVKLEQQDMGRCLVLGGFPILPNLAEKGGDHSANAAKKSA